jgi:hypothetical protein
MCGEEIHLFEHSAILAFAGAGADRSIVPGELFSARGRAAGPAPRRGARPRRWRFRRPPPRRGARPLPAPCPARRCLPGAVEATDCPGHGPCSPRSRARRRPDHDEDAGQHQPRARVPLDWAMTQMNLGSALSTLGERESGTARLEEASKFESSYGGLIGLEPRLVLAKPSLRLVRSRSSPLVTASSRS